MENVAESLVAVVDLWFGGKAARTSQNSLENSCVYGQRIRNEATFGPSSHHLKQLTIACHEGSIVGPWLRAVCGKVAHIW